MIHADGSIVLAGLERLGDDEFYQFCAQNDNLRIERNADGTIIIMSPESPNAGKINAYINFCLFGWNLIHNQGTAFGADTGFTLPDKSMRSPDACWVSNVKMATVSAKDMQRFSHVCPEFIVEVLSASDSIKGMETKMEQWMANGALLGWMINPKAKNVRVYRAGKPSELLQGFDRSLSGEDVLPGFELDLRKIPK